MNVPVEIWLRGDNHATTAVIALVPPEPRAWTEADVAFLLTEMLRALHRAKHPDLAPNRPVSLRGFSWIVNPYEDGGVVIALELTLGAVIAGPFDIAERELSEMIQRAVAADCAAPPVVH